MVGQVNWALSLKVHRYSYQKHVESIRELTCNRDLPVFRPNKVAG